MNDHDPRPTGQDTALDRLLERDRPEPGPDFDARFFARLAQTDAEAALDDLLDPAVGADRPEPGPDFDARLFARLAETDAEAALDGLLDPVVGADRPAPSPDFDRRVMAALEADATPSARSAPGGARILRFMRRPTVLLPLLAAAAMLVAWVMSRPPIEPPADELELLGHMELLEVYDEMEVLDGIADEETFELVAMLHTLDDEEALP